MYIICFVFQAAKENEDLRGKKNEQSQKLTAELAEQLESALTHTKVCACAPRLMSKSHQYLSS